MGTTLSRRQWLCTLPGACAAVASAPIVRGAPPTEPAATGLHREFPAQDPRLVREVVGASHARIDRVRELVEASPALAKASWDWGFGDWESALGAAATSRNC